MAFPQAGGLYVGDHPEVGDRLLHVQQPPMEPQLLAFATPPPKPPEDWHPRVEQLESRLELYAAAHTALLGTILEQAKRIDEHVVHISLLRGEVEALTTLQQQTEQRFRAAEAHLQLLESRRLGQRLRRLWLRWRPW